IQHDQTRRLPGEASARSPVAAGSAPRRLRENPSNQSQKSSPPSPSLQPSPISPLSCADFNRPKPVFIRIIAVALGKRQRAVGIARPAAGKIERIVDAADLIFAADAQRDGIIFTITRVRQSDLAQDIYVESARRAQPIDAQRVVAPVRARPFAM